MTEKLTVSDLFNVAQDAIDEYSGWFVDDTEDDKNMRKDLDQAQKKLDNGIMPDLYDAFDDYSNYVENSDNDELDAPKQVILDTIEDARLEEGENVKQIKKDLE